MAYLYLLPLQDKVRNRRSFLLAGYDKGGVNLYHCFGCNASGTVIRMHQHIQKKYYNRELTEPESCKELASLFNIPLTKEYLNKWFRKVENKTTERVSVIHNNISLEHFIISNKNYLFPLKFLQQK